jgi:hypothetical protein
MFFVARVEHFAAETWIGRHIERFLDEPMWTA